MEYSRNIRKSRCKREIENLDTVLRYMDYFEYGFSEKKMEKKKKKILEYKKKLEKKVEEDDFDD